MKVPYSLMANNGVGAGSFGVHFLPLIFFAVFQPFTVEAGVRSKTSPCGSFGRQGGDGKRFSPTISLRRPGFDPRQVRVGALVGKVVMGKVFPRLFLFSPVTINPSAFPISLFACRLR